MELSRGSLAQDGVVEGLVGDQFLELAVFTLKHAQALGLVRAQAAVLFAPAVVGLLGDRELLAGLLH